MNSNKKGNPDLVIQRRREKTTFFEYKIVTDIEILSEL